MFQALGDTDQIGLANLYMKAFKELHTVVESCFGQTLDPAYSQHISAFMQTYRSLGISVTLKAHVLERHVVEFITEYGEGKYGLGKFSEQAFESNHHETAQEEGRLVSLESHPNFPAQLKAMLVRMNGKRL